MNDSLWHKFDMEQKIRQVLSDPRFDTEHHFNRPFLTPYQIAIALDALHPDLCADLGMDFGGKGTGKQNSFVQYIARELSARLKHKKLKGIEGAFLSNLHLEQLTYQRTDGTPIVSSNTDPEPLSLCRLSQPKHTSQP